MNKFECSKHKVDCLNGVGTGAGFDDNDKFINSMTVGNKIYLQFYKYSYLPENWGHYHRWWTTVYDTVTHSYLPYKKDIYLKDDDGWYKTNITYTPTQFDWFKSPERCHA